MQAWFGVFVLKVNESWVGRIFPSISDTKKSISALTNILISFMEF